MYENKIKKELLDKILKCLNLALKLEGMVKGSGLSWEGLRESSEEFENLDEEFSKLISTINLLIIDTKYFPLVGLTDTQQKLLSTIADGTIEEKDTDKYLDVTLINVKEAMKERLQKVKPIYLTVHIDPRTSYLYTQAVRCYINGAFEAACVLCRAIAESIAKRYIEYKGFGDFLTGKTQNIDKLSVAEILKLKLSVPNEIISLYKKIGNKADNILHKKDEKAEEQDALETIKHLQSLIEKFPKSL